MIHAQWTRPGFNFRFTDILASIGLVQLGKLPQRIERAREIYETYRKGLEDVRAVRLVPVDLAKGEIPVYIEVLAAERERLLAYLDGHGIDARPFYPDLDRADYLESGEDFPNSRIYGREGLYLPAGPAQPPENVRRVIETLRSFR